MFRKLYQAPLPANNLDESTEAQSAPSPEVILGAALVVALSQMVRSCAEILY